MNLSRMMIDRMFIERHDGSRHGPFKTRFGGDTLLVFREDLLIAEGERIIQPISDGSELGHLVEGFSFNPPRGKIPAHFSIRIIRTSEPIAVGDNAIVARAAESSKQDVNAALEALEQAIASAPFPGTEKSNASRMLLALRENEVIAFLLKHGE